MGQNKQKNTKTQKKRNDSPRGGVAATLKIIREQKTTDDAVQEHDQPQQQEDVQQRAPLLLNGRDDTAGARAEVQQAKRASRTNHFGHRYHGRDLHHSGGGQEQHAQQTPHHGGIFQQRCPSACAAVPLNVPPKHVFQQKHHAHAAFPHPLCRGIGGGIGGGGGGDEIHTEQQQQEGSVGVGEGAAPFTQTVPEPLVPGVETQAEHSVQATPRATGVQHDGHRCCGDWCRGGGAGRSGSHVVLRGSFELVNRWQ
jgi:hypothetical protein